MSGDVWTGILVYVELEQGQPAQVSRELIAKASELAEESGEQVYGICIGSCLEDKNGVCDLSLKKTFFYHMEGEFQADRYGDALVDCIEQMHPSTVLIGGTTRGRALAPRVAVHFRTGVTADCTELAWNEKGNLVQTRPAFGGNIMASILTAQTRPQIATVRPGVFSGECKTPTDCEGVEVIEFRSERKMARLLKMEETRREEGIEKQDVLVVAGRGVKKKEDLEMLRELAELLGGALASSRALVEKGWMKPNEQIGLSGTTVKPKYMITFGVSGTVQFMAGMKNTPNIIAVNTDPEARIFEIAHYSICADLYQVVPELIQLLKGEE